MSRILSGEISLHTLSSLDMPTGPKIGKYIILGLYQKAVQCIICDDDSWGESEDEDNFEVGSKVLFKFFSSFSSI